MRDLIRSKGYSYLLVSCQFVCIVLLVVFNLTAFNYVFSQIFLVAGFGLGFYTLMDNRVKNFNIVPDIKKDARLVMTGAYRYVRHPMYSAVAVIMFGMICEAFTLTNISIFSVLVIVLYLKAIKEERLWIKKSLGYRAYMKRTKMFVPFIF